MNKGTLVTSQHLLALLLLLQTCVCVNRILVEDDVHDEFVAKLSRAMNERLLVGDGLTEGVTQGPLVNHSALHKVTTLIATL